MANQNDSFIDEVTEDLRRDRLFAAFRRYGWIAGVVIVGIVGGAIWREVSVAREKAAAQDFGDAVLAAEASGDPAALLKVDPQGSEAREALLRLLAAGEWAEAGGTDAAVEALQNLSDTGEGDPVLRDLAQLKLVMLQGGKMDPSQRDQILSQLSRTGAPFELLALEQKAIALIEAGRTEDAISLIRQIQQKSGLSEPLRRRLSEMMIALGVEPDLTDNLPSN
ncbi:tetratricopeptide repeat protein [Paracoccus homiensis]|uniref:Ancillary SecYEG translocon subunit/Cell division coordinator CpoB TPR domain-containing protein n=1 Tax=Paracoccus homiensis TaxID=364199 RepID=A0A1I0FT16_9RHOB|nr:tetratricopeptide repeat protein [Paracoccus homiensis]SET60537.1 hypothetical protein SAMN04489858_10712 [Paracoccus homiensis]